MRRRSVGLFFICSAVVPLAIVSAAWACGRLATIQAPAIGDAGQTGVQVSGNNYARNTCTNEPATCDPATLASAVTLKWNSRTGPTIGTDTTVQSDGKLNTTVNIPQGAKSGPNVILALQNTSSGVPKSGTPGRTIVNVSATRSSGASAPGAARSPSKARTAGKARACRNRASRRAKTGRKVSASRNARACRKRASRRKRSSVSVAVWSPSKPEGPAGTAGVVRLDGAESATPALIPALLGGLLSVGLLGTGLTLVRRSRTAKPHTARPAPGV